MTVYLDDDEAADIWRDEVKVPAAKISRLGEDENFWPANAPSLGPDGVCGPCSEIYYHVDAVGDVEIWNLVLTKAAQNAAHSAHGKPRLTPNWRPWSMPGRRCLNPSRRASWRWSGQQTNL